MKQADSKTVVIVGAGLSGICMGIKLKQLGVDFLILETTNEIAGTWSQNGYPGCGCDIPMFAYCYSFEIFQGEAWPKQPEILQYFKHCVKKYHIEEHILFEATVKEAAFDTVTRCWNVELDDSRKYTTRFLINATGQLNIPNVPEIKGMDAFQNPIIHSARYPADLDVKGRTVAILGNGATALQIVEALQPQVEKLLVFARSPKYIYPRVKYSPITLDKMQKDLTYWQEVRQRFIDSQDQYRLLLDDYPQFDPFDKGSKVKAFYAQSSAANFNEFEAFYEWMAGHNMRPEYPTGCSRPLASNTFHEAVRASNVKLIGDPIRHFNKLSIKTSAKTYPVDFVILATGFSLNNLIPPYLIKGSDGTPLSEAWRSTPDTYLGMATSGYPNLFFLYGPNTNTNASSVTFFVESQVNYICEIVRQYLKHPFGSIEVKSEVLRKYTQWLYDRNKEVSETSSCSSWYKNQHSVNISTFPGGYREYEKLTNTFILSEYHIRSMPEERNAPVDSCDVATIKAGLRDLFSKTTLLAPDEINMGRALRDYALDSILIVDFIKRINERWMLVLEPAIFFEYASLQELSLHLVAILGKSASASHSVKAALPAKENADKSTGAIPSISEDQIQCWRNNRAVKRPRSIETGSGGACFAAEPSANDKPIAIIGAHGYLPKAPDLEAFWDNLVQGEDCISQVPAQRWDWQEYYGDPLEGDKTRVKWGGFIEGVDKFDPLFFKMNPKEARLVDPQHRLFLQCAWELIEGAGYNPNALSGKKTGVILGINLNDYADLVAKASPHHEVLQMTGLMHLFSANRLSYLLGLTGPSEVIDTACSSSLVAIHRAIHSIRHDNCEMMLAGGSNLILTPKMHLLYSKAGMLSEDGRCKTFSSQANGYVRGEGVAAVLLKPLAAAEKDGDMILGVIRGSAENHGGKANSLTAPNPKLQAQLIEEAMLSAKVDPRTIGYIECHGTGTALGDPIEINGIKKAYENLYRHYELEPPKTSCCGLGSVKSNIGHLETAAGIAGVIKVLLCFKHRYLPETLHCSPVNSQVHLEGTPFYLVKEGKPWEAVVIEGEAQPRRAGVSSFGAGGSNAHLILEEYCPDSRAAAADLHRNAGAAGLVIIPLSARTEDRLRQKARDLLDFLRVRKSGHAVDLPAMAYTLQVGREAMAERLGFIVSSVDQLAEKLQACINAERNIEGVYRGRVKNDTETLFAVTAETDLQASVEQWIAERKLSALLELWVNGLELDWNKFYGETRPRRINLPTYPFAKERYWIESDRHRQSEQTETGQTQQTVNQIALGKPMGIALTTLDALVMDESVSFERASKRILTSLSGAAFETSLREGNESAASFITLYDCGGGVFSLQAATVEGASEGGNRLSKQVIEELLQAIDRVRWEASVKVLILTGTEHCFLQGGRKEYNEALELKLYRAIASFPYPVIAAMQGSARGAGFLVGALCDFMICAREGEYCYTLPQAGLYPSAGEDLLFKERFGAVRAQDFLYHSSACSGGQLQEKGWTCPILPQQQVVPYAQKLASALSRKQQKSLRLLKQHLARHILGLVEELTTIDVRSLTNESEQTQKHTDTARESDDIIFPALKIHLETHAEKVLIVRICVIRQQYGIAAILADLADIVAQVNNADRYKSIVLVSDFPGFLPQTDQEVPPDTVLDFQRLVLESRIPVIAVLDSGARGIAWLISQFCDVCVYNKTGRYSAANVWQNPQLAKEAAMIFSLRFGNYFGKEILLTNTEYSGIDLQRRVGALKVTERNQILPQALQLAELWAGQPLDILVSWKKHAASIIQERIKNQPAWLEPSAITDKEPSAITDKEPSAITDKEPSAITDKKPSAVTDKGKEDTLDNTPVQIALNSRVMAARLHPQGILVVKMEDREAKNMFSEDFIQGIKEVFQHIEQTPAYKVVILTGYDNYFASGGTKEVLLAIQEGKLKFTDVKIYQLAMECKVPVIAAMQGHGIGAGWSLGMFADFNLFSEESKYFSPYMNYGFTPGAGSTLIFPDKIGCDLARETMLTAQEYAGSELKARGLWLPVLPRNQVVAAAMALAGQIAQHSRPSLIALKQQWTQQLRRQLEDSYNLELAMHEQTFVGQTSTLQRIQNNFLPTAGGSQSDHSYAEPESTIKAPPRVQSTNRAITSPEVDRLPAVTAGLKKLLAQELHMQERDIDENMQFIDLGLDSISGATWVRKINEEYNISIDTTKIYSYPTLTLLSGFVKKEAQRQGALVNTPVTAIVSEPVQTHASAADPYFAAGSVDTGVLSAITASLKTLLAQELHMQEREIDENMQFIDLGLDSINGVTWVRKINEQYTISMEATRLYSYPTLTLLSGFVKEEAEKHLPSHKQVPSRLTAATVVQPSTFNSADSLQPVAVIGMAGQFPQAKNLEEFWQNIAQGKNCISQVPRERWDIDTYYQQGSAAPGKTYSKWMGALEEYDRFDPLFFNISPTEAERMDPQQRLFLQACWHSIEHAGYNPQNLSGSKCGVFVGCGAGDYQQLSREQRISAQGFTGDAASILGARISYFLNLQGPCLSIDTACSSSLVAIASACDSLISGGSDLALAGGVYVMASPEMHIMTSQVGMLSPDGRCFSFDQRANGIVVGEGVGVVMLKRLADAERDRDRIHAVIQGWGINQDGKTNGITAPNPQSQTRLQQEVYDKYRIDPANIQLIEAHGTGTKLGDPMEVDGLKTAFKKYTGNKNYCALGSVKSNIGHCLMAAGVAGVIKLILALKHKQLPPTINFEQLNEHISLRDSPFFVNSQLREWELQGAEKRQAAISSFSFSGTNAHMVIEEYSPATEVKPSVSVISENGRIIIPLSARTEEQLKQKVIDLLDFIRKREQSVTFPEPAATHLTEMAYTLQIGREAMEERLGFMVSSIDQLAEKLQAYIDGEQNIRDACRGQVSRNKDGIGIISQDPEMKETLVNQWVAHKKLSKLLDLWVKGLEFDWHKLYGGTTPQRINLPVYPFAKERYWIDTADTAQITTGGWLFQEAKAAPLHPLLHSNTSDLNRQSYSSTFSGAEFFLKDHRVKTADQRDAGTPGKRVLPGVAYLEMARAAVERAVPARPPSTLPRPGTLELYNVVWLQPIVVTEPTEVTIALFSNDDACRPNEQIDYEIYTTEAEREILHCQGQAVLSRRPAPARLDMAQLRAQMQQGKLEPDYIYAAFTGMGLDYGPAHRGITAIHQGEKQLLAQLRLPEAVAMSQNDFMLHPSLLDSALQASIGLIFDLNNIPSQPALPFVLESLRIISACTKEMFAWARYSQYSEPGDKIIKLDVDMCDQEGNICVQIQGFSTRVMPGEIGSAHRERANHATPEKTDLVEDATPFDNAFYERVIERVLENEISVDQAVELG